ncbi:hypothetical protein DER46DRAFT_688513 [Fusarium sp. MPI-SDFR-AT-0072]|nr:hypothetical protein DER46DRAFT_688513 [Fusarium sp. MPI-SDFR-AT-0072]
MLFTGDMWNKGQDLLELVSLTKSCHATDPRDKILALIGLAGDRTYGIVPGYDKTESVVFTEVALKAILQTRNLKALNYSDVEDPNDKERFPLWAPRWYHKDTPYYCDMSYFDFKSPNGMECKSESLINTQILKLKGLNVDKVKETHHPNMELDQNIMAIGSMGHRS